MLVHESVRVDDHADLALRINTMWHQAGYASAVGHQRLEALWLADFAPVCEARADGLPVPASYDELRPYVSGARQRIGSGGNPVIIVNGDSDKYFEQLGLDFDRTPHVWKILVGGTKLSRGFTIEGLTTTYYRRTTQQADTLMQMGRWFGFRPGYRDLVRLYIGRKEALNKTRTVDLYEAFEAICQDEEAFRAQLAQYAVMLDGKPQMTPSQVRPLVSQHLALMRPAARNKMHHSELVEIRSPGQAIEPAAYPQNSAAIRRNIERWRPLLPVFGSELRTAALPPDNSTLLARSFQVKAAVFSHSALIGVLSQLEWEGDNHFAPHLNYLTQLDGTLAKVDDWLLVAPQTSAARRVEARILESEPCSLVRRSRQLGKVSFGRISGLEHRRWAQGLVDRAGTSTEGTTASDLRVGPRRGVVLLYPVVEASNDDELRTAVTQGAADPARTIFAFSVISPTAANDSSRRLLRYRAK